MNVIFLVNGSKQSSEGERAIELSRRMPTDWNVRIGYREGKFSSILRFIQIAITFKPDVVYVIKMAYTGVLAGVLIKFLMRSALISDTGDLAYELAKSTGRYSKIQLELIREIEQLALKCSDAVVTHGSYHKSLLLSQGVRRVEFIPDGIDIKKEYLVDTDIARSGLNLGSDVIVGMIGHMEWSEKYRFCYGWDVIEAMAHLRDCPVKAILIGDGDGLERLQKRASDLGVLDKILFLGRKPRMELGRYLAAMDVCISTQSADKVGMVRTTGKLPLYLAHGKYVIATNVGEAMNVLPPIGCLLPYTGVRDDHYPILLANQIRGLIANRKSLDVKVAAREVAEINFDYQMLARRVERLCDEVLHPKLSEQTHDRACKIIETKTN